MSDDEVTNSFNHNGGTYDDEDDNVVGEGFDMGENEETNGDGDLQDDDDMNGDGGIDLIDSNEQDQQTKTTPAKER